MPEAIAADPPPPPDAPAPPPDGGTPAWRRVGPAWAAAWREPGFRAEAAFSFAFFYAGMVAVTRVAGWVEHRPGALLHDPVLALFPAVDVTAPLFFLVYGGVLLSFLALLPHPHALVVGFRSYGWVAFLRSVTLLVTPLDPPAGMILLRDPIVEATVHGAVAPTRDLFFSGHTSTLLLVALVTPGRRVKTALATAAVLVGTMVLLQKVHYTIDVVCALPFALTAAWLGRAFPRRRAAAPAA